MSTLERSEQTYWDRRYAEWWDRPFHGMCQVPAEEMALEEDGISRHLDALLRPHHHVLDAACGYGRLAPMICERVKEYVGVDFARKAIEAARLGAPGNARFIAADILDVTDERFDVIVLCGAWSSIQDRATVIIDHLLTLLHPEGLLAVFEIGSDRVIAKDGSVAWL